jgi:hypothetical protein
MARSNEERRAAIAFILDRAEQFPPNSGYHAFAAELVGGIAEGRHVESERAGFYNRLHVRVRRIIKARASVTPLVHRPKMMAVR